VWQSQDDSGITSSTPSYGTLCRAGVPVMPGSASSDVMSEMTLRLRERRARLDNDANTTTSVRYCSLVIHLLKGRVNISGRGLLMGHCS